MKDFKFKIIYETNEELVENFTFTNLQKAIDWISNLKSDKKIKCWHIFELKDNIWVNKKNWYNQLWFPF